ncbi:MAG: serine O-acetyltransferase [Clostridiales bacterium]|nr:serine O-acetyltransferase [Clostridiales bacterium]
MTEVKDTCLQKYSRKGNMGKFRDDLKSFQRRDPAARNGLEVFLLYSGFHAVFYYRIAHWFHNHGMKFMARAISQFARFLTGIEIHPAAVIGRGLFIDHGSGVVIGETTEIGDYCTLYQGVTLGGTGIEQGKRHPTLEDHVLVGAGAKVLGPFRVGKHAKIAAGAVVLTEVPEYGTAVGVPAKILTGKKTYSEDEKQEEEALDHIHIEDPVMIEIIRMEKQIKAFEKRLKDLEKK